MSEYDEITFEEYKSQIGLTRDEKTLHNMYKAHCDKVKESKEKIRPDRKLLEVNNFICYLCSQIPRFINDPVLYGKLIDKLQSSILEKQQLEMQTGEGNADQK